MKPADVRTFLESSGGRIFSVTFIKRTDNSLRKMVCRLGVQSHLTGGGRAYDFEEKGLLGVFDLQKNAYRTIPLENIITMTVDGETHKPN